MKHQHWQTRRNESILFSPLPRGSVEGSLAD
jgi:hypothetical protein